MALWHKGNSILRLHQILIILTVCFINNANADLNIGDRISNQTLYGLNTTSVKLSSFIGKPLIINFWASWCSPCLSEMDSLNNVAGKDDFTVIGISTDDDTNAAIALVRNKNLRFKNYVDHQLTLEKAFGVSTIPLTIIVDSKGIIKKIVKGSRQWDSKKSLSIIHNTIKKATY